jgi:hypothetical protein
MYRLARKSMKARTLGCVKRPGGQTEQMPRIPTGKPGIEISTT